MLAALKQEPMASEQRLIFFFWDPPQGGYYVIEHDDVSLFDFKGDAREAAWRLLERRLAWLHGHEFCLYVPFWHEGIEYHPVLVEFGDGRERDVRVLKKQGFTTTPRLRHPLSDHLRRANLLFPHLK